MKKKKDPTYIWTSVGKVASPIIIISSSLLPPPLTFLLPFILMLAINKTCFYSSHHKTLFRMWVSSGTRIENSSKLLRFLDFLLTIIYIYLRRRRKKVEKSG